MLEFLQFRLDSDDERLWKGETLLSLRRKPFAILRYLVQHPKKLVTHEDLLTHVWHGTVVSESALRSHMFELRQALGDGVIETVIGRGYRFVAELRDEVAPLVHAELALVDPLVVGREPELERLRAAFERARAGQRQLCFVTGKPGIGKSTLVRAFLAGLDAQAVLVGRGCCFEQHGTPEPYLAVIDALDALTRSSRGREVRAALIRHAPTFVAQLPHLIEDEQLAEVMRRAAGSSESRQLRELSQALEAVCAQEPLVLVLEDLQWSDVATIDLLSLLGQRQERAKLLVIATSRHAEIQSTEHPLNRVLRSLVARSAAVALQLPKLDASAVQRYLDQRFPGHSISPQLTELVWKNTGGTPLFMVSLLDELAGREMLAEREGRWSLTVSIDDVQAHRPASIKQLIDMQIDRLTPAEQRVLEAASIVGAHFSTALVAAALELPVDQVDDTCDSLARRSLFVHAEVDVGYGVRHALVQEVCLERTSPGRRQRWHRLVAEAVERDPHAHELPQLLAKHYDAAGDAVRAVPAYAAAARMAAARYASSDSVALCARALQLLPRAPPGRDRDALELQILGTSCQQVNSNSFRAAFAGREPLAVYQRAIEIARSLGHVPDLYAAITQLCNYNMICARYELASEPMAELEQLEQEHELGPELLHAGIFARAYIAFFSAEPGKALHLLERLVPDKGDPSVFHDNLAGRTVALGHLACARWVVGDADRALAEALATIALADEVKVPVLQALGHVVLARLRFLRRDALAVVAPEVAQTVRTAAVDLGLLLEASVLALWADSLRAPVPLSAIEPLLDQLQERLTQVATCSTLIAAVLIEVLRASGHAAQARTLTDDIIAFALAHQESVYLPELLRLRGEQTASSDPALAARDFHEAIALSRATGSGGLERRAAESLAALSTSSSN